MADTNHFIHELYMIQNEVGADVCFATCKKTLAPNITIRKALVIQDYKKAEGLDSSVVIDAVLLCETTLDLSNMRFMEGAR